jgi:hypothetical protein
MERLHYCGGSISPQENPATVINKMARICLAKCGQYSAARLFRLNLHDATSPLIASAPRKSVFPRCSRYAIDPGATRRVVMRPPNFAPPRSILAGEHLSVVYLGRPA